MKKVVTFGELLLRLSPIGYNRFMQDCTFQASYGGAEANVAVSLANFGLESIFVTKLPNNAIGKGAVSSLRSFGVDTSKIKFGGERMGIYFLEKGVGERASICLYDRNHSSIQTAVLEDFDWDSIFQGVDWFHFTGITPALSDTLVKLLELACIKAKEKNITISCDINYRSKLWNRDKAHVVMSELCNYVDVCIANEEDAKDVFGIETENSNVSNGIIKETEYELVAKNLMEKFPFKYVAITLRKSISASDNKWSGLVYDGEQFYFSREHDIRIVDRVGGGDSFGAGLIYSIINNKPLDEAIEFAISASALQQTIEGDFNRVTLDEVNRLVQGDKSGRIRR